MADISTAVSMARVPILGEDGRISDDYIPAAIGENVTKAESAAKRAETAATNAEGSATAASQSAAGAKGSASAAAESATKAQQSATAANEAVTRAQSAQQSAEAAKTGAESARDSAQTAASQAQQSAASVADKFITSAQATTLEPGSQATASVADQVLTLGVPRGEKGDKGDTGDPGTGVPEGGTPGQLLSKTDSGTAWVDPPSGNVLTGEAEGLVAHAEDAFPQKPREVRIKGKTWVNRWPVLSGTHNGITVATDGTGLVTVTGTATADADVTADVSGWATGKSYTTMVGATPAGCSAYFEVQKPSGNTSINATTAGATLNVASDATNCFAGVHVTSGTTVNASFRVMLVDGTEAPDCFTPCASITSVQPEKLVTAGKNLLPVVPHKSDTVSGVTITSNGDGSYALNGTATADIYQYKDTDTGFKLPPGTYTVSGGIADQVHVTIVKDDKWLVDTNTPNSTIATTTQGDYYFYLRVINGVTLNNVTVYPQLELGSTATSYEPPTVTQTPLPEVELRSLPNGTCDELVIRADGTCEVERKTKFVEFDGSADEIIFLDATKEKTQVFEISINNPISIGSNVICDILPTDSGKDIPLITGSVNGNIYIAVNKTDASTVEKLRSWLAKNKPKIVYLTDETTEPQSPVTLPALPAPTFNQYHDADIPSDTTVTYERDLNIVIDNLAKQIAGTAATVAVNEATR